MPSVFPRVRRRDPAQGINCMGFHADTMHMARLWDSARLTCGGYSLEALTSNEELMRGHVHGEAGPKVSMKKLFQKPNIKADGTEGKVSPLPLQPISHPLLTSAHVTCCRAWRG